MLIKLDTLEVCPRVRVRRQKPDSSIVEKYAEAMQAGAVFPPIDVFQEANTKRWIIADGEHRVASARKVNLSHIEAVIHEGDEVDALEWALGCNADHGLPRSQGDIHFAFRQLREQPSLVEKYKTNQDRADLLQVSVRTIQRYEAEWRESDEGDDPETVARKGESQDRAETHTPPKQEKPEKNAELKVVDNNEANWDQDDQASYDDLSEAWSNATSAARRQFMREVG